MITLLGILSFFALIIAFMAQPKATPYSDYKIYRKRMTHEQARQVVAYDIAKKQIKEENKNNSTFHSLNTKQKREIYILRKDRILENENFDDIYLVENGRHYEEAL